jgi:competence protein ComEC
MLLSAYFLIYCCVLTLKKPRVGQIKWAMISVFVFQLSIGLSIHQAQNKREWLVLHQKKATAIIDRYGSEIWVFHNENAPKSIVENYATDEFINKMHYLPLEKLAQFQKHKIAIVDASGLYPKNAAADIILLSGRPRINLDRLIQKARPKLIIADGSNYPSSIARWEASCQKQKIPFHYTGKKGFFELTD